MGLDLQLQWFTDELFLNTTLHHEYFSENLVKFSRIPLQNICKQHLKNTFSRVKWQPAQCFFKVLFEIILQNIAILENFTNSQENIHEEVLYGMKLRHSITLKKNSSEVFHRISANIFKTTIFLKKHESLFLSFMTTPPVSSFN